MTDRAPRSVVMLAYRFPPMLGPGSHRAASFARHLPDLGWKPLVVTADQALFHRDPGYEPPPIRIVRTRAPEPSKLLGPLRRRAPPGDRPGATETVVEPVLGPGLARVRRWVRDWVYLPDGQVLWIPFAVVAARRALRASGDHPKVLLSTSVPYSAHLAALIVARLERVPWVAEFRDPWSQLDDRIRPRSAARRWVDATLERLVIRSAQAIVVTSELTREATARAYPEVGADRIRVVRNGFEPLDVRPPPPPPDAPLALVQAGSVPEDAPLEPLLRGIGRVEREHPGRVSLLVLGSPGRWARAAAAVGDPEWLVLGGLVAPVAAQQAVAAASANVLLRPGEAHHQYVAAKLMEYLGARRPVLAVVSSAGEMARLGADFGDMRVVEPYLEETVAAAVGGLLQEHRDGLLQPPTAGAQPVELLTRRAQTDALARVLEWVA